jgi:hypothetical protein
MMMMMYPVLIPVCDDDDDELRTRHLLWIVKAVQYIYVHLPLKIRNKDSQSYKPSPSVAAFKLSLLFRGRWWRIYCKLRCTQKFGLD